jgi:hypothetical protein
MANKIQLKRGGLGNIDAATGSAFLAEPIVVTGSVNNLAGPILVIGDGTGVTPANKLQSGATTPTVSTTALDGVPFYNSTDEKLYILGNAGNSQMTFDSSSVSNVLYDNLGNGTTQLVQGTISASAFTGDGSNLSGVTAEWDGTHTGDASITGSFAVTGSSIKLEIPTTGRYTVGTPSEPYIDINPGNWYAFGDYNGFADGNSIAFDISSNTFELYLGNPLALNITGSSIFPQADDRMDLGRNTFGNQRFRNLYLSGAVSASSYTGSFQGDGSGITNISAASLPSGLLSGSAQIASDISGSFTSTSASIASDIATNLSTNNTQDSRLNSLQAATSSYVVNNLGDAAEQTVQGTLRLTGDVIAENYIISSSVTYMTQSFSSGSTIFGDTITDTHQFTGSVSITGSLNVVGGTITGDGSGLTNITAVTSSYALTASFIDGGSF